MSDGLRRMVEEAIVEQSENDGDMGPRALAEAIAGRLEGELIPMVRLSGLFGAWYRKDETDDFGPDGWLLLKASPKPKKPSPVVSDTRPRFRKS